MQLDYNESVHYEPDLTGDVLATRDVPGPGVEFDIHYTDQGSSGGWSSHWVSSPWGGQHQLGSFDVSEFDHFALAFQLVAVDGDRNATPSTLLRAGALLGPARARSRWAFSPEFLDARDGLDATVISRTAVGTDTANLIGFTFGNFPFTKEGWPLDGFTLTVKVSPVVGAVALPEPGTLISLCGLACFLRRRSLWTNVHSVGALHRA